MGKHCPQGKSAKTVPFFAGVSTLGNTEGKTGSISHGLILQGGHNITLKEKRYHHECATVKINARDQSVQTQNMFDLTLAGNIIGAPTIISSGTMTVAGGNNITLSQAGNAITISAGASILSHNSVYHTGTIGAESQISFDTLSGHDHDGIDSKLIIIPQYLEVALSGKKYTSVKTAIDSIVDASATKPYVVKVYPGVYTESPFSMKQYVTLVGSEYVGTTIQTNDNTNHFITGAARSTIRNVTIVGPTGSTSTDKAAVYYTDQVPATTAPFVLQDILIRKGYHGVWADATVSTTVIHLINVNNWYNGVAMHTFARATGYGVLVAQASGFMCGAPDAITTGFEAIGSNAELYLFQCYFRGTPDSNIITGIFVDNDAYAVLSACVFSKGTIAIHAGSNISNGPGIDIFAAACVIRNDEHYSFVTDIKIDSATAKMDYNGIASRTKLSIVPDAEFTGTFNDITDGAEGMVNLGELYLGTLDDQLPLRDYGFTTYLTGQKSGGEVTTTGLLGVHIDNGAGFINTSPTVPAVKAIAWLDADLDITTNTREWIYVDSTAIGLNVKKSSTQPDENNNIILAVAYANATDVVFLASYVRKIQNFIGKIDNEFDEGIGNIWIEDSGLDVTENLATPLRLDVTTGNYLIIFNETTAIGDTPITFTYWYGSDLGGWTTVTSQNDIDVINYDNSGILAAMTDGKWKKDALYVAVNDNVLSTTQYHIVYGQEQFNTQADAENGDLPTPPSFFENYSLQLVGIVVQKSTTNINKIIDIRPRGNYVPPGHNTLSGIQGGNSALSQYYHINSTEHANLSQRIAAISGSNNSISGSTITFGNSNNLSFYITNNSVVGSFSQSIQPAVQQMNDSSGSMSIVGGDNITVNNNDSTISIYAPANILNSFSISGNTGTTGSSNITGGGFVIAGGNNITLSQSNNTISIYGRAAQAAIKSLSAGTTQITTGQAVFSDDHNVTFGIDGQTITASVHAPNTGISSIIASDITYTQGSVQFTGAGIVTISANNTGNPITINASQAALTGIAGSAALTVTTGLVQFANANNISFGLNSNTMTASYSQSSEPRIISLNGTSGELSLSGASNITVSTLNGSTITIYGPANILNSLSISGNIGTTGSSNITGGGFVIAGGNNITLSQSNNTISIYGAGAGTDAAINAIQAGTNTGTSGTIVLSNSNNVTFGMAANGSVITASASFDATNAFGGIEASNTTYTSGIAIFTGVGGGITVSSNTGQRIDLSVAAQSIQTENMVSVNGSTGAISISGGNNITVGNNNRTITISGPNTHAQQTGISSIIASDITYTQGGVQFTGAGIVTVSANNTNNPITINAQQTIQPGIRSLSAGTTQITTGQAVFSDGNNITFGIDGQTITASVHAQNTGISSIIASDITYTQGSVQFTGAGAVTISANNTSNPITINAPVQTLQTLNLHAIVVSNNTSGLFTIGTSGTISLAGTNMTITANTANSSIIGFSVHPQQTGISGIQASDATYASGTVRFTGVGGGITVSSNTGQRIDLSVAAQSIQTENLHGLVVSNNTSGATTIGTSGTVSFAGTNITITVNTANNSIIGFSVANPVGAGIGSISAGTTRITSGEAVFSNSNNISFGASGQTITASVSNPGILSMFAGTTRATSGEVVFSNANNISFGMNAQTMTASVADRYNILAAGTQTANTSGTILFSNANSVTFGMTNSSIMTASIGMIAPTIHAFDNFKGIQLDAQGTADNNLSLQKVYVHGYITATEFEIIGAMSANSRSAGSATISAAIYTMTGATANLASSASTFISWNSGSSLTRDQYGGRSGTQYREILGATSVMNWHITPGDYLVGVIWHEDGDASWTFYGMSSLRINALLGSINHAHIFGDGLYSATTDAFPLAIQSNEQIQTGSSVLRQPWFRFGAAF